jgi:N-hydroxyarylamine O-acetyltransferase
MDLQKYLKRLQLDISVKNDFTTLQSLHRAQAFSIPFENFNVHLKHPIPLDIQSLFKKLILNNRGGYCYELNILFCELLREIGFDVTPLIGRPLYGYNNAIRPKTHMVLKVKTQGKEYLCDLGFGGRGLIEPMELVFHQECEQFGDTFKLVPHPEGYELQTKVEDNWVSLYSFDLTEQKYIDFELANFFNMHSPDSRFTQQVICAMPTETGRILLLDKEFKTNKANKPVSSHTEYDQILSENFGISQALYEKLFDS